MSRYPQQLHWVNGEFVNNRAYADHTLDIVKSRYEAAQAARNYVTTQQTERHLAELEKLIKHSRTSASLRKNLLLRRSILAKRATIRAELDLLKSRFASQTAPKSFDPLEVLPEAAGLASAGYELTRIARGSKINVPYKNVPLAALLAPIWTHGGKELYETFTDDKHNVFTAPAEAGGPTDWAQHNHGNTQ